MFSCGGWVRVFPDPKIRTACVNVTPCMCACVHACVCRRGCVCVCACVCCNEGSARLASSYVYVHYAHACTTDSPPPLTTSPGACVYSSPGRRTRSSSARASHEYRQTSTHAYTHTSLGMFQPSWVSFLDWPWLKGMLLHHLQVFGLACGCVCQPGPEKFQRPRRGKAETILPSRRLKEQSTGRRSTSRSIYISTDVGLAAGVHVDHLTNVDFTMRLALTPTSSIPSSCSGRL